MTAMEDLVFEDVLDLHRGVLNETSDDGRVFSEAALHQLVFRINSIGDPYERAALAIFHSVVYPAFRDGNKRTAASLAARLLAESGITIDSPSDHLFELMRGAGNFAVEQEEIEAWLRENGTQN